MKTIFIVLVRAALPITVMSLVAYVAISATITPPFTTLVDYDESLADSRLANALMVVTIGLPLLVGLLLHLHERVITKEGKNLPQPLKRVGSLCGILPVVGLVMMSALCAFKAVRTLPKPVWHYWAGQSIGWLGVFLLIVLVVLWRLRAELKARERSHLEQMAGGDSASRNTTA